MTQSTQTSTHSILVAGRWQAADAADSFTATNPATGDGLSDVYPVSRWADIDNALDAAASAFAELRNVPRAAIADFLRKYAEKIESHAGDIAQMAHTETALPFAPRLKDVELPRTTGQLRQAATACEDDAWRLPTIDADANIRSILEPVGPVAVFGPNNFPLAFNGISGGDFAAAIAGGCPVIAKAHESHPTTTRLLAELAQQAAADLPAGVVQLIYSMSKEDGLRMVADPRLGAAAFTGSRAAGLKLKHSADEVGKPFFAELSSINPVVLLPGALNERFDELIDETVTSGLMGAGQFCTNPGLIVTLAGETTERYITAVAQRYADAPTAPLLGGGVLACLKEAVAELQSAGQRSSPGAKRSASRAIGIRTRCCESTERRSWVRPSYFRPKRSAIRRWWWFATI